MKEKTIVIFCMKDTRVRSFIVYLIQRCIYSGPKLLQKLIKKLHNSHIIGNSCFGNGLATLYYLVFLSLILIDEQVFT